MPIKQNSDYLANENPIPLFPALARAFGEQKALIIQQIRFWMNHYQRIEQVLPANQRHHFQEGRWWVYNTYNDWEQSNFDWIPAPTLRRLINKLEVDGVLLSGEFNRFKGDRTKWYSIDFNQLDELIAASEAGRVSKKAKQKAERKARYAKRKKPSAQVEQMGVHSEQMGVQSEHVIPETTTKTTTDTTLQKDLTTAPAKAGGRASQHQAIEAYRQFTKRYPPKIWYEKIIQAVGDDPMALERWSNLVFEWIGHGWNPSNVSGMLDAYTNGGIREGTSGNGSGKSSSYKSPGPLTVKLEWDEIET